MLVLSRKPGEKMAIGTDIMVTVLAVKGSRVTFGVEAPDHVRILRSELCCWQNSDGGSGIVGQVANLPADEIARLEIQVQSRLSGQIRNFHVLVRDDGLVLQGHTRRYYAKQLAQHLLIEATGLPVQANQIEVS